LEDLLAYLLNLADNPFTLFAVLFTGALVNTFFPPVPIELGTVFAGYLSSEGHGSMLVIISATTLGMFTGSVIFYRLIKTYGMSILKKPFFARLINEKLIGRTEVWLEKYGALALIAAKLIPGMYFCAVIGSALLSLKKSRLYAGFFLASLAGFTIHAFAGKLAGENWRSVYAALGETGGLLIAAVLLIGALVYFLTRLFKKQPGENV
jgi:membrane protein DedA with SNARE-associated domain